MEKGFPLARCAKVRANANGSYRGENDMRLAAALPPLIFTIGKKPEILHTKHWFLVKYGLCEPDDVNSASQDAPDCTERGRVDILYLPNWTLLNRLVGSLTGKLVSHWFC